VVISIWWSTRLRRPAAPRVIEDLGAEDLREAVESGRAALAEISDARAAIIACYVAMERSLAEAPLNGMDLEMVETIELAEQFELIKDLDFISDMDVIDSLDEPAVS
jgi:hypothetical protein